jgi:hypothetical protein
VSSTKVGFVYGPQATAGQLLPHFFDDDLRGVDFSLSLASLAVPVWKSATGNRGVCTSGTISGLEVVRTAVDFSCSSLDTINEVFVHRRMSLTVKHKFLSPPHRLKCNSLALPAPSRLIRVIRQVTCKKRGTRTPRGATTPSGLLLPSLAPRFPIQSRKRLPSAPTGTTRKPCFGGLALRKTSRAGGHPKTEDLRAAERRPSRPSQLRANPKRYAFH